MKKTLTDIQIYRAFLDAKSDPTKKTSDLPAKLGITHWKLYNVVNRIKKGDMVKINRCTTLGRWECLWEYKYKIRYQALPKGRKAATIAELRELIREMRYTDQFPQSLIAKLMKKDRSTIIHHLES